MKPIYLREPQHILGAYPRHPQTPQMKEFLCWGGFGMFQGYVGKFLESIDDKAGTAAL